MSLIIDPVITKINEENTAQDKFEQFWELVTELSNNYLHDPKYVRDAVENLFFAREIDLEVAKAALIKLVEAEKPHYRANCLAIAAYASNKLNKLGIAHNILAFNTIGPSGRPNYHAVIVYRYQEMLLVCDIPNKSVCQQQADNNPAPLIFPFEEYPNMFNLMTGGTLLLDEAYLYDPNITAQIKLSDWPLADYGFFSEEKFKQIMTARTNNLKPN